MTPSPAEAANLPRWRGEPGFFEIWFLVAFDAAAARAWWFRYTLFAPAAGRPEAPRATLWAAAFDVAATPPVRAVKSILPIGHFDAGSGDRFAIRLGDAELTHGRATGRVAGGDGTIAWDLAFVPAAAPVERGPRWLERLPLPTRVTHAHGDARFSGWVEVDGVRHAVAMLPGLQKHIWGSRRVEELFWIHVPAFDEDPGATLEATAVRVHRTLARGVAAPSVASIWLRSGGAEHGWWRGAGLLTSRVEPGGPGELQFRAASSTRRVEGRAWCDPKTLAGWVYRDPSGVDLHVAQSDVASCHLSVQHRRHVLASWSRPTRLTVRHAAAVEFHHPEPLPGVRYLGWDEG
jgi:hypothetical protein